LCNSGNSFKAQRSARETHDGNWAKFVEGWAKSVEIHSTLPSKGGSTGSALAPQFEDMMPHAATSAAAGFDSKVILVNKSWRYTVPQQKGDFDYICSFHPTTMTAKLQVR
jgi:hypothetical protein